MMARLRSVLPLAAFLCVTGAAMAAPPSSGPGVASPPVSDFAGERCEAVVQGGVVRDPNAPPPLSLRCNGDATPVGVLRAGFLPANVPATGPQRRVAVEAAAHRSLAAAEFGRRMTCGTGQWIRLADDSEAMIGQCTLREGNWPQLTITYARGRVLYQGTGLPVVLPVLARAIAAASDAPFALPAAARDLSSAARLTGGAIPAFTARDYATYDGLIRQARLFNSSNNSADAEGAYRAALDIQTRVFGPESAGAGQVLIALALEVSNQQRFDEAASLFRRADPIIERSSGDFQRGRLLAYRALDAANRSDFAQALQYARASTVVRRRSIDNSPGLADDAGAFASQQMNRGELLHSLMIEAQMYMRLDDLASAEASAAEALDIVVHTEGLPAWWRPNMLAFMGDLNEREGRLTIAERQHLDALRYRQRLFGETEPTALSHLALGRIYAAANERDKALASYKTAFDILARQRAARSAVSFNLIAPFLRIATDVPDAPGPDVQAEIFRAFQLAGASVADQTIERAADRLGTSDPALAARLRETDEMRRGIADLRIAYAQETDKPAPSRDPARESALASQIVAADAALTAANAAIAKGFPAYQGLAEPPVIALDAFRARLNASEAVVDFAVGNRESWVLLVSRDRLVARSIPVTDGGLATSVAALRQAVVPRLGKLPPFDLAAAHALYGQLLGPVEADLAGIQRLVVITRGPLATLPVAVLVRGEAPAEARDYAHADWLVRHYAVSQMPSLHALVALRQAKASPAPRPLLAFAAPSFAGPPAAPQPKRAAAAVPASSPLLAIESQCRGDGPVSPALLRGLTPLPETATEAMKVAAALGAPADAVLTGAAASEEALRQHPLGDYRVLYFATHGLLPSELRCHSEPGLALSPPPAPSATRATDGLLDASEIAQLKLNADLVVLSACNTAEGGGRFGGDALSGLAEAFFFAGARGVVASHWEVPSQQTVTLMTGMFDAVATNGSAEALRQAQLRLADAAATAHPFYWAGFTLIGDGLPGPNIAAMRVP